MKAAIKGWPKKDCRDYVKKVTLTADNLANASELAMICTAMFTREAMTADQARAMKRWCREMAACMDYVIDSKTSTAIGRVDH